MTFPLPAARRRGASIAWVFLAALCALYGAYALSAAAGLAEGAKIRALPAVFALHAVAGAAALVAGAIQFHARLRARRRSLHRWLGRLYVGAACTASLSGIASAASFAVGPGARLSFALAGALWLVATLLGWRAIRRRDIPRHRAWMTRSFALALFFISYSLWKPLLAAGAAPSDLAPGLPPDLATLLAVTLGWTVNLAVAEAFIRRPGRKTDLAPAAGAPHV